MSFESPEGNNNSDNRQERIRDRIISPHAEAISDIFKGRYKNVEAPVSIETIKDILYTFIEQAIENTRIYSSEDLAVSFPYTTIRLLELSEELFSHHKAIPEQQERDVNDNGDKSVEFIFGSFVNTSNGHEFTFFEEAMHQLIKKLPRFLEEIDKGENPDDDSVYVLGSPTNELGTMSTQFLESMKGGNTFKQFGALYAEFIDAQLPKDEQERENLHLYLYGISMGSSFATQTAEHLLNEGKITQSHEISKERHIPFTQVRADTLPGASDSSIKKWQIPLGFVADNPFTMLTNAYTRVASIKEVAAMIEINKVLAERGIVENMTPEQKKMKEEAILGRGLLSGEDGIINDLRKGVPIDDNLKLTEVRAVYDPLQYSGSFRREVKQQRENHKGSLGENMVSKSENRRVVGIDQAHTFVFFRENELKRIEKAAAALEKLKN